METYHKIHNVFKRDPKTKTLLEGEYSLPEFEYLKDNEWVFTEKIDGTNIRVLYHGHEDRTVTFGGKTDKAQMYPGILKRLNELFLPEGDTFKDLFKDAPVCLYGEGFGKGIQKGGKYLPHQDFVLFDVKVGRWWLKRSDIEGIAKEFSIDIAPIVGKGTLSYAVKVVYGVSWPNYVFTHTPAALTNWVLCKIPLPELLPLPVIPAACSRPPVFVSLAPCVCCVLRTPACFLD